MRDARFDDARKRSGAAARLAPLARLVSLALSGVDFRMDIEIFALNPET